MTPFFLGFRLIRIRFLSLHTKEFRSFLVFKTLLFYSIESEWRMGLFSLYFFFQILFWISLLDFLTFLTFFNYTRMSRLHRWRGLDRCRSRIDFILSFYSHRNCSLPFPVSLSLLFLMIRWYCTLSLSINLSLFSLSTMVGAISVVHCLGW